MRVEVSLCNWRYLFVGEGLKSFLLKNPYFFSWLEDRDGYHSSRSNTLWKNVWKNLEKILKSYLLDFDEISCFASSGCSCSCHAWPGAQYICKTSSFSSSTGDAICCHGLHCIVYRQPSRDKPCPNFVSRRSSPGPPCFDLPCRGLHPGILGLKNPCSKVKLMP